MSFCLQIDADAASQLLSLSPLMTSHSPSQIKGGIHPMLLAAPQNLRFPRRVKGSAGRRNQTGTAKQFCKCRELIGMPVVSPTVDTHTGCSAE